MAKAVVPLYGGPNTSHDMVIHDVGMRVGYGRAVSHDMNSFANESFIDELAAVAGKDPSAYRAALLGAQPRMADVLKTAADKAGWGTPTPAGRFRGTAMMEGYDTCMAQGAEISMKDGVPAVHKVTIVADLGRMVNPDTVEAQLQSSISFGLTAALYSGINFHQYQTLRMNEAPVIDITLVPSTEKPGGIGEPATALIGLAVANVVFAATGKRLRKMPLTVDNIEAASGLQPWPATACRRCSRPLLSCGFVRRVSEPFGVPDHLGFAMCR